MAEVSRYHLRTPYLCPPCECEGLEGEGKPTIQPEKPVTTKPIDTSNWKIDRNEKYGFEFKYPEEHDKIEECKLKETKNGVELGEGRFHINVELLKYEYPLEDYVTLFVAKEMQELGMLEFSLNELVERNLGIPVEKISIGSNEGFRVNLPGSRPRSVFFPFKKWRLIPISLLC